MFNLSGQCFIFVCQPPQWRVVLTGKRRCKGRQGRRRQQQRGPRSLEESCCPLVCKKAEETAVLYSIMGNICFGTQEERPKPSAFSASGHSVASNSIDLAGAGASSSLSTQQNALDAAANNNNSSQNNLNNNRLESTQIDKETREEESRLELLVQTAGRAMVAVRSTRGSNPYYDQGFAAALAQHLEQTTQFPTHVPPLPSATPPAESSVYHRLSQSVWEDLQLGPQGGLAGCAGENPEKYLDRVAESFLDQVVPKKGQLFTNAKPIVESLL